MLDTPVTLADIAKAMGVSVSTVSRALRAEPGVAGGTRRRALELAAKMGYSAQADPKQAHRTVPARLTAANCPERHLVVLVRSDNMHRYYGEILADLWEKGPQTGYAVDILTRTLDEPLPATLQAGQTAGADAIILITWEQLTQADGGLIAKCAVPVVVVGRHVDGWTTSVTHDDIAAGVGAAHHLLSLGHRRIAHVAGPFASRAMRERATGFQWTLEAAGCYHPELFIQSGDSTLLDTMPLAMEHLLSLSDPPTAVWIPADFHAGAAVLLARNRGLDIPGDLSIMGFDRTPEWAEMQLTTFDRQLQIMARHILQLTHLLLSNAVPGPVRICVPPRLVLGATTGPVRS